MLHRAGADQRAGAAQRLALLAVEPELERRPALNAVRAVLGREQRLGDLGRRSVGPTEHRSDDLLAVTAGSLGPHSAQRQQAAVGEGDPDRPPHDLTVLAHRPAAYGEK